MAHNHAVKAAVEHAAQSGTEKAMVHGMEEMMHAMMTKMMQEGPTKGGSFHNLAKGASLASAASSHSVRTVVGRFFKHPLVLFGLGVASGYLIHKYRKEILAGAGRIGEVSKDFVLQQRENLEDLFAKSKGEEGAGE